MSKTRQPTARYTTREIAARLFLSELRTRHLLLAANVPHTKSGVSYLWDAESVDKVVDSLQLNSSSDAPREGKFRGRD